MEYRENQYAGCAYNIFYGRIERGSSTLSEFFRLTRWSFIRRFFLLWLLAGLMGLSAPVVSAQATIGVLPFKNTSGQRGLDQVIMNSLVALLTNAPDVTLIDRTNMKDILTEQTLKRSTGLSKHTSPMLLMNGMDYFLTGTILDVQNISNSKRHKKPETQVTVFWKLLDTVTGRVVCADTCQTSVPKIMVKQNGKKIWLTAPDALPSALQTIALKICSRLQVKLSSLPLLARVASIDGDILYIDRGAADGVVSGQIFSIYQQGKMIRDPDSGAILGQQRKLLCQVLVDRTDQHMASGRVLNGSADAIRIGDAAEVRQ